MKRLFMMPMFLLTGSLVISCGFGGAEDSGPGVTGTWVGEQISDSSVGPGGTYFLTLVLQQSGDVISGSYNCGDASTTLVCPHKTGFITGNAGQGSFTIAIDMNDNSNTICDFTAPIVGNIMGPAPTVADLPSGTYVCRNGSDSGNWDATKQ